jgi:hypothetical protein
MGLIGHQCSDTSSDSRQIQGGVLTARSVVRAPCCRCSESRCPSAFDSAFVLALHGADTDTLVRTWHLTHGGPYTIVINKQALTREGHTLHCTDA